MEAKGLLAEGGLTGRLAECCKGLHPNAQRILRQELADRMRLAEMGKLTLETTEHKGTVRVMRSADRVLEIRFARQLGPVGWQHTRLYFTEPAHLGAVLLALHLDWKRDDPDGRTDQDEDIQIADARIDAHYRKAR